MEKVLSITDLSKSYGSKRVIDSINLDVYKGQIIGYIGPNGAGKSTTVKILLGLIDQFSGQVKIFGQDINENSMVYKKRIGYVPENAEVYDNLTAFEYMTFVGGLYGLDKGDVVEKVIQFSKLLDIQDSLHSRLSSFSKGMKQKVLLISSLLHNPDILFLDEPLSGLDANSVMIIKELLSQLASEGKTIFYSSHIMDVVEKISNRIILISEGRIVADGTFEELKQKNKDGTLEEIFNELTGFDEHKEISQNIVNVMSGRGLYE
ncbi:ABC transporter ATP-binding protein [Radiobacillus kanasensis]|uniref:ABC transporter ATP-binding protein n=1 Tax=Radiobacillus kanasensis TaxID=2844358 RepID=UPI001E4D46FD|nr:ABC transporter ATP-binding protein [Radiobacillus kanasensis]UFT99218.1 ABC transporter ATP-binding protein [Radiobacillus kanasensis]